MDSMVDIEIMAPAGSFESLRAAIEAGASSVYFGVKQLNMRAKSARNFTLTDLKKNVKICNKSKIKAYLALNVVIFDEDFLLMRRICDSAKKAGIHAVIASDIAVIRYANQIGLEVHISTQLNVANIEAVRFFAKYCDVMVLARELKLNQIKAICTSIKKQDIRGPKGDLVKIEIFVHGALCVSVSGKCYMSLATYDSSANRGACLQNCRRKYRLIDDETGDELVVENGYVMSPRDLSTIGMIDKIISAGVTVLKIEGRARKEEYVYTTVKAYKEAVDSVDAGNYTKEKILKWAVQLKKVYNRGFWEGGYYLGKKTEEWSGSGESQATTSKTYSGKIINYYSKKRLVSVQIESGLLCVGDELLITGPTTGVVQQKIEELWADGLKVGSAKKGSLVTLSAINKVRKNDKVYVLRQV